jgi:DNA-binding GntR family transcriptional regulator
VSVFDVAEPISRTAAAAAAAKIREAIVEGRLDPGARLKEESLASELGISRTPIREALLVLQSEGLVEYSPNRGSAVRTYTQADLEEMYDLRALLEGRAARRAAERVTAGDLADLEESCTRFGALVDGRDVKALVRENAVFHETIQRAAASERLAAMIRSVVSLPLVYRSYVWYSPEQAHDSHRYHEQLVAALRARDGDQAEAIMERHVDAGRRVLLAHIEALEEAS